MKKFFRSKKFIGVTSALLATSLVLGTIAVRRSQKGIQVGIPTVNADSDLMDYDSSSQVNYSTVLGRAVDYGILTRNLEHLHHMQTTFATSVYTGGKYSCDANLSGPAAAQFIVAEMTAVSSASIESSVVLNVTEAVGSVAEPGSPGAPNRPPAAERFAPLRFSFISLGVLMFFSGSAKF